MRAHRIGVPAVGLGVVGALAMLWPAAAAANTCPPVPEPHTADNPAYYAYVNSYDGRCASTANWDRSFPDVTVAAGGRLELTTSTALAGAVASLKWDGKELLASGGHGAALQFAFHAWHEGGAASECYNPTQAGSRPDDAGPPPYHGPSTSALYVHRRAGAASVVTGQRPAMYVPRSSPDPGFGGCRASDFQPDRSPFTFGLSPYWLDTQVSLAPDHDVAGLDNVVRLRASLTSEDAYHEHFDGVLVAYLQRDFGDVFALDPVRGLRPRAPGDPGTSNPVIGCTADHATCLGLSFRPAAMPSAYYYTMTNGPSPYNGMMGEYTAQVTVPGRGVGGEAGRRRLDYEVYVVVGDLERAVASIRALSAAPPPASPAPAPESLRRRSAALAIRQARLRGPRRRRTLVLRGTTRPALAGPLTLRMGAGRHPRTMSVPVVGGRFKARRVLRGPATRRLALSWAGDASSLPARQRLWAARRSPRLRALRVRADAARRVRVAGRVHRRARGVVAIEIAAETGERRAVRARVRRGRFSWQGPVAFDPAGALITARYAGDPRRGFAGGSVTAVG